MRGSSAAPVIAARVSDCKPAQLMTVRASTVEVAAVIRQRPCDRVSPVTRWLVRMVPPPAVTSFASASATCP